MKKLKLLKKALSRSPNISFQDIVSLVEAYGFKLKKVNGSHHIFAHDNLNELVNLQNVSGKAKPYQIRQFLELVERYDLELGERQ